MAHRRTFSARFPDMRPVSLEDAPLTPIPNIAAFPLTPRKPKAYWYRTTFLALFVLIIVSVYVVLVSQPTLRPISFRDADRSQDGSRRWTPEGLRLAALKHRKPNATHNPANSRPQITLNQTQELAAVSSFIAALPQNMIPLHVDPSKPLDPQLILDFDTSGPHADEELQAVIQDVWTRNPVMLYSKVRTMPTLPRARIAHSGRGPQRQVHSPLSREIKQVLDTLYLRPAPTIVDVDQRRKFGIPLRSGASGA